MAFCTYCGHEISDQAVACPRCGHPTTARGFSIDFGVVARAPYSSYGSRVGAFLIDGVFLGVIGSLLLVAAVVSEAPGAIVLFVLFVVASLLYKPLMEGAKGQTLGKMVVGIKVVRAEDASPIGYGEAFMRWVISFLLGLVPFLLGTLLDLLWPLWDDVNQTLHDKGANTIVVDVR